MCSTRRRKLAETALSVALLLSTLCFQTSAAQSCRSSIPGTIGAEIIGRLLDSFNSCAVHVASKIRWDWLALIKFPVLQLCMVANGM